MEALNCINCGNALDETNFNERSLLIVCANCGSMHDVYRARHGYTKPPEMDPVPIPDKFQVTENGDELHISFKHHDWIRALAAGFGTFMLVSRALPLFWDFDFLGNFYNVVAMLLSVLIAGSFLLRKVRIVVRKKTIKLGISSYLLLKPINIAIDSVDQLFVRRHTHKNNKGETYTYTLNVIYQEEKARELLSGFHTPQEAQALEHLIERWSGIADVKFAGEYRD